MRRALVLSLLVLTGCSGVTIQTGHETTTPTGPSIEDVSWIVGEWVADADEHGCIYRERWRRESAQQLVGRAKSRCPDTGGGHEPFHEDLQLDAETRGLVYVAIPIGQIRTEFDVTSGGADGFVAENPEHDFPTRIEYRRTPTGIEATVSGPGRSFTLVMHPAPPEDGAATTTPSTATTP